MLCALQHADGEKPYDIPIHIIVETYACILTNIFQCKKKIEYSG